MIISTDDPRAVAAVAAIHSGDVAGLERLLDAGADIEAGGL